MPSKTRTTADDIADWLASRSAPAKALLNDQAWASLEGLILTLDHETSNFSNAATCD